MRAYEELSPVQRDKDPWTVNDFSGLSRGCEKQHAHFFQRRIRW